MHSSSKGKPIKLAKKRNKSITALVNELKPSKGLSVTLKKTQRLITRHISSSLRQSGSLNASRTTIPLDNNELLSLTRPPSSMAGVDSNSHLFNNARSTLSRLAPLGSDPDSEESGSLTATGDNNSGNQSDSPFILDRGLSRLGRKVQLQLSHKQLKAPRGSGDIQHHNNHLETNQFNYRHTIEPSNHPTTTHHTKTHHPTSLHTRQRQKKTPTELLSFRPSIRTASVANGDKPSMNDEISDRLVKQLNPSEELTESEEADLAEILRVKELPLQDTTVPDQSQLTRHYPDLDPQAFVKSDEPVKAKIHPRLRKQIEAAQKLYQKKQPLVNKNDIHNTPEYQNRFELTDPLVPTVSEQFEEQQDLVADDVEDDHDVEEDEAELNRSPPGSCTIEEAMECVVKIFVTQSLPNFLQPWQKRPSTDHMGSGFVIKGKRIVTNAHVVADALVVMIRRPGSSRKFIARVVASAHECDLALLEVVDESFWGPDATSIDFEQGRIGLESQHTTNNLPPRALKPSKKLHKKRIPNDNTSDFEDDDQYGDDDDVSLARSGGQQQLYDDSTQPSTPDLPGVGPGSVGSPWWTSLAPDAPRSKKKQLQHNNTLMLKDDTFDVPLFSTTTPFFKESGSLYVSPAMPGLQSSVVVIGYPLGGDNVSITQGVVSRIEPTTYAHTGTYLLAIQIDAAINPGNSGGPALSIDGRVIGVAFQNITNASNVGYIIPAPVIIHFLRDVQRGAYRITKHTKENMRPTNPPTLFHKNPHTDVTTPVVPPETTPGTDQRFFTPYLSGFPSIGLFCQETTSESLRDYIGLSSCTKLTPVGADDQPSNNSNQTNNGFSVLDSVAELRRYREFKNHQALDTPVQHFQRLRQYQSQAARLANNNTDNNSTVDINGYQLFNYETTNVPAAYSHYYMLEQHIKEDVRRKRQFPMIDHGVEQVGISERNNTLTLINKDYEVNRNDDHPFGFNHQGKNSIVHVKQRYNKDTISGVLVSEVSALSAFHKLVFPGDVLLSVDGHELGSDGSVHFRGHERIAFDHITSLKHNKQIIQLTILRRKKDNKNNKNAFDMIMSNPNSMFNVSEVTQSNEKDGIVSDDDNGSENEDYNNYHVHNDDGLQYEGKHKFDKKNKKLTNKPSPNHQSDATSSSSSSSTKNTTLDMNNTQSTQDDNNNTTTTTTNNNNNDNNPKTNVKPPQMKKLKLKNKTRYKHRIVSPCDSCSKDVQIPTYNATYFQNIHETDQQQHLNDDEKFQQKLKRIKKTWNTALGISADFIYTKQNNPALKEIIKNGLEQMKNMAKVIQPPHTPATPIDTSTNATSTSTQLQGSTNNTSSTTTTPTTSTPEQTSPSTKPSEAPLPPPLPNSINSPAHYTRLPLNYTKLQHPGKQYPDKYHIPSASVKHMLCVHEDFEIVTIKAPVSILPTTSPNVYDRSTAYVFFGGLLFVPLSYQYTKDVGNDAPLQLTFARCAPLTSHDEEKVVLAQVLQDNETVGYPYLDRPISHICGVPVRNMKGLLEVIHTKSITASVSNLVKSTLLKHPQDLPLLIHMLQHNNITDYSQKPHITIVNNQQDNEGNNSPQKDGDVYDEKSLPVTWNDSQQFTVYNVTPEAEKRCRQLYDVLCSLSDILCSETDVETYTGSLLKIYNTIPSQSPWKRYLLQVLDMYLYPNELTPTPRTSSLSSTTHDTFTTGQNEKNNQKEQHHHDHSHDNHHNHNHEQPNDNGTNTPNYDYSPTVKVATHIHREHTTPTKQALLALFHHDIRKYPLGSIPLPFVKADPSSTSQQPQPPLPFSPIDFLPFKPHTMTVQTTENKLITLDMERAIGAHYRLKETLNI